MAAVQRPKPSLALVATTSLLLLALSTSATAVDAPENTLDTRIEQCVKLLKFGEMNSNELPTKVDAVVALGLIGDERVVPVLIEHYQNESNQNLRFRIIVSLGWIGSKSAIPTLEAALKDPYYFVRSSAAGALKKMTGKSYKYDTTMPKIEPLIEVPPLSLPTL